MGTLELKNIAPATELTATPSCNQGSWLQAQAVCWASSQLGSAGQHWANGPAFTVPGSSSLERAEEGTAPSQRAIIKIWKPLVCFGNPKLFTLCLCHSHLSLLLLSGGYLLLSLLITYCNALKIGRRGKDHHREAKCYILYMSKARNLSFHKL